ncbi:hypothetical protein MRS44_018210 [Fusarium solani]|uniref:uncharacterized protein n=1 Tax=Fusarium solani TaxID=169388 RepID=UPI0032C3F72B|nr:hypothetical protein MRS44_018210 [Fusarium solani]
MSIFRLPSEMLVLIIENADIDSIFNLGLTCSRLNQDIHRNERIGRIALNKASYSTEAIVANTTKEFARGFRQLAKRRMAVRSAEPWTVAIIAMAERFIYTDGYLCYTIKEHLRILNIRQTRAMELVVNTQLLMRCAVRDFNRSAPYTFEPLYCAKGILSCLATQVDDESTSCWLIIFEAKNNFKWVVVKPISSEHQILIRNNKEHLFCITKSPAEIDGSMRWALQRLDLRTRQWSDDQIIPWDIDGSKAGEDICFEIIDHYFYCLSLERRHQTDYELRGRFYQAVRFSVNEATPGGLEKPPKHHLWRRHDSEGHIHKGWASLQLIKDESTGDIFIVEIRQEWPPVSARSQRTCYKKRLEFGQGHESSGGAPLLTLPISNGNSPVDPERECREDFRVRHRENTHVDADQIGATTYTLSQCPLHTYNPSCDAFVDLVYGENSTEHFLQLRVHPEVDVVEQDKTVKLWPEKPHPSQPDDALAQVHEIMNLSHSTGDVEWAMDERILVYSHKPAPGQPPGQLRPITLMSFDSSLRFPVQPGKPELSQESASVGPGDVALPSPPGSLGEWLPSGCGDESTSPFVRLSPPLYQNMSTGAGTQHGFDMSYDNGTAGIT